ncbi:MAG: PD-(D/E)XK nuclease family protein [Halanaerobiales bacterium]|nr:PD-(D/E)XK nuclease family protein [Halanaerobiales bacterium]
MLEKNLNDLYFSQSALIAYQNCPLKFRRRYFDGLFWPADWGGDEEQREAIEQGRIFHLLAQRYYSRGEMLDSTEIITENISHWFERLVEFRPFHENGTFLPEHELRLNEHGIKIVAKYDLLYITSTGRIIIYDWKTNHSRPKIAYWRNHLQTIVYRYLICKVGGVYSPNGLLKPENITMIYWNPKFPNEIEPLPYNHNQFLRDESFLTKLIQEIKSLEYNDFLATGDQKKCKFCEYRPICHGQRALQVEIEEEEMDFDLNWESIDEIQF